MDELPKVVKLTKTRSKYFEIFIEFNVNEPLFKLPSDETLLQNILEKNHFPHQKQVQDTFQNFKCLDRSRQIRLKIVSGKLVVKSLTNFPYWKILCETTALITRKKMLKCLNEKLLLKSKPIKVRIIPLPTWKDFQQRLTSFQLEQKLSLTNSLFFPGYFNEETLLAMALFETPEVQVFLKESQIIH